MRKLILLLLFMVLVFAACKNKHSKYSKTPDYIFNPEQEQQSYFEAYDESLKLWNVAFDELYVPTKFGTAHVIVSGPDDGMPVILLHGMNASSTMWYPNIKALSDSHRVYAIDFILEPGKSYITKTIESTEDIAAWYHEIFTKLELEKFSLIGASRGGWLATEIALQNQDHINSMILLSPAQTFIWVRPSTDLLKNIIYAFSSKEKQMEETLKSMSVNPQDINKKFLNQYRIAIDKDSINKFTIDMMPFSKRELQTLKMPVYVLIGDDDMINNNKTVEMAREILPYGRAEVINNAGHFLSIDQSDIVNTKMVDFLEEMNDLYK